MKDCWANRAIACCLNANIRGIQTRVSREFCHVFTNCPEYRIFLEFTRFDFLQPEKCERFQGAINVFGCLRSCETSRLYIQSKLWHFEKLSVGLAARPMPNGRYTLPCSRRREHGAVNKGVQNDDRMCSRVVFTVREHGYCVPSSMAESHLGVISQVLCQI